MSDIHYKWNDGLNSVQVTFSKQNLLTFQITKFVDISKQNLVTFFQNKTCEHLKTKTYCIHVVLFR